MGESGVTAQNQGNQTGSVETEAMGLSEEANKARVQRYAEIAAHLRVAHDRPPGDTLGR
jgi:hypothetical protein